MIYTTDSAIHLLNNWSEYTAIRRRYFGRIKWLNRIKFTENVNLHHMTKFSLHLTLTVPSFYTSLRESSPTTCTANEADRERTRSEAVALAWLLATLSQMKSLLAGCVYVKISILKPVSYVRTILYSFVPPTSCFRTCSTWICRLSWRWP